MPTVEMKRGENRTLPDSEIVITLQWTGAVPVGFATCLQGGAGQPATLAGIGSAQSGIAIERTALNEARAVMTLSAVGDTVDKIEILIWRSGQCLAEPDVAPPLLTLSSAREALGSFVLPTDMSGKVVAIFAECYRRNAVWKIRAVGDGFDENLTRLAAHLRVQEPQLAAVLSASANAPISQPPANSQPPEEQTVVEVPKPEAPITPQEKVDPPAPPKQVARPAPAVPTPPEANGLFSMMGWQLSKSGVAAGPLLDARDTQNCELLDVRVDQDGNFWPASFAFRPDTGQALPRHAGQRCAPSRALGTDGLASVIGITGLDAKSGQMMDTVPEGVRYFGSGGTPPRLIALDPDLGLLFWYAPWSKRWIPIDRCPLRGVAEPYGFGMAGNGRGVFFAVDDYLVHVLPGQKPQSQTIPMPGIVKGPVAVLGAVCAVPVQTPNGSAIALTSDSGVTSVPIVGDIAPGTVFAAPVMKEEASLCFWQSANGYLAYEHGSGSPEARYYPWPGNAIGLPFLKPWRARTGLFWAKVKEGADGPVALCAMSMTGRVQRKELRAPCICAGGTAFRGRERYDDPAGNTVEELNLGHGYDGNLVVPLLRIESGQTVVGLVGGPEEAGWRSFQLREGKTAARPMALALHNDNGALEMLEHRIDISTTDDFELFFCEDRLFIHHYESGTCKGWQFSFAQ